MQAPPLAAIFSRRRSVRIWCRRSSQIGMRCTQGSGLVQEMLVGAIERLVTLGVRIPANTDWQSVGINGTLERCEVQRQSLFGILLVGQAPAGDATDRGSRQKTFTILQVFVTAQDFRPLAFIVFRDYGARDDGAREIILR